MKNVNKITTTCKICPFPLGVGEWPLGCEDVRLIVRAISFQDFLPYVVMIHQRHRQTDRWTDRRHAIAIPRFALWCIPRQK